MNTIIKKVKVEKNIVEYVQAAYEDYRAKQDLLAIMFDIHKFDQDDSLVKSVPFKAYEKEFAASKVKYDYIMETVKDKYIPEEYKKESYRFEVNFEDNTLDISEI